MPGLAQRVAVEAVEQQQPRVGAAQPGEQRGQSRFPAARRAFEQDAVTRPDGQIGAVDHGVSAFAMAEEQVLRIDHRRAALRGSLQRARG